MPKFKYHRSLVKNHHLAVSLECEKRLTSLLSPLLGIAEASKTAVTLLAEGKSLASVLAMKPRRLLKLLPQNGTVVSLILAVRQAMLHSARERLLKGRPIRSDRNLREYLSLSMADETREQLRVLYFDSTARLITDEVVQTGSLSELPLYCREIVISALDRGAASLILVHNHPSGDPTPSALDLRGTQQIAVACKAVGIGFWDHLIVARSGVTSLRALGRM